VRKYYLGISKEKLDQIRIFLTYKTAIRFPFGICFEASDYWEEDITISPLK